MTKTLKGQSARSFATSSTEDFVNARGLFLSQPARIDTASVIQPLAADTPAVADTVSSDLFAGRKPVLDTYLDCPVSQYGAKMYAIQNGLIADRTSFDVPPEIADEGTLNVTVGGSVSGNIDAPGDHDTVNVFLISGQTYLISLRGTGATPIKDSYLEIFNPSAVSVGHDDDGGNDLYSIFTFTAAVTGNFSIDVSSFPNPGDPGLGGYTVDVRVRGVDAVGNSNATSVHMDLGTTFGFRETGTGSSGIAGYPNGDVDRYSVTLEAGHFYTFKYAGGIDYENGYYDPQSATNMDTILVLRDSAGNIVAQNDDVGFPEDLSSGFGFFATVSGTYYLDAFAYANYAAGYVIDFQDVDLDSLDPFDVFSWASADNIDTVDVSGVPTAYVYFALPGESFGELNDAGTGPRESFGWSAYEKAAVMSALTEFTKILGIQYVETSDANQAEFRLMTTTSTQFGAYFYPQDPGYGSQMGIGAFNVVNRGWNEEGPGATPAVTTDGLQRGGFAYGVILHEFGHAHGLAHPHDTGGGSDVFPGTAGPDDFGVFNLNQMVYTQMSYNGGWVTHPDGALEPDNDPLGWRADAGWSATLSAFDIDTLQRRYGILNPNETGDTVYTLKDVNDEGTWYECIWDTGGTDTIAYNGATRGAVIDLTAATIDYTPTGGGVMSFVHTLPGETTAQAIKGGFTIAKGVVIENATGGGGDDVLVGNSAANVLTGNGGADAMIGRGGDDTLHGGAGTDTAYYDGVKSDYTITAIISGGAVTGFTVKDNNTTAPADSNNPILVGDEGTDTLDGVEALHFSNVTINLAGGVLVFDASDSLVGVYTTIQAAIDDASTLDGYRVFVSSGTYNEDVTVSKDLTIEGANAGTDGTDGGRIAESVIKSITVTHAGVTVDGVEVTGDKIDGGFYIGVNVKGSDFTLTNSVLSGRDGDFVDDTVAVMLNGSLTGLDVGHNLITGYIRGVYIVSGTTEGDVHDNTFQGAGPVNPGFDGMGNGINTESQLVTIQNNIFDGIWAGVVNVGPLGADPADLLLFVLNNIYTNNAGERPIQVYPTNEVQEIYGTDENEAFSADIAVDSYGITNASFTFHGRGGDDHIYGHTMGDFLYGDAGDDQIFASGGDDTLEGGEGNDALTGGSGIDTALFSGTGFTTYLDTVAGWALVSADGTDFASGVEILEDGTGQRDLLVRGSGFTTLQAALDAAEDGDHVRLAAGAYTGTAVYDNDGLVVYAQPGATQNLTYDDDGSGYGITVYAAGGADNITGGDGGDYIDGGAGADTLNGGGGNDFLIVDNAGDTIVDANGSGFDNVASSISYTLNAGAYVEILSTTNNDGTASINLVGNELANILVGNNGSNYLDGGIDGGDRIAGRGGNDAIIVDTGDYVEELDGGGYDNVAARSHYVLNFGAEVEVLSTTNNAGTDAIDLTGNEYANVIVGNAGSNVLDGSYGHDRLAGFGGADSYQFSTFLSSFNIDTIDGYDADDIMLLDSSVFTGMSTGPLAAGAFHVGTSAGDADDRIIYDTATGALYFDQDGVGGVDQIQFAVLLGAPSLDASDFSVI